MSISSGGFMCFEIELVDHVPDWWLGSFYG
jgi:hypothetical protein